MKILVDSKVLEKIISYAKAQCDNLCPEVRDPETCVLLVELCKVLKVQGPPCIKDYGGFSEEVFKKLIVDIEKRHDLSIQEFLKMMKVKGPSNLQEQIDEIDGKFALEVLKVYREYRQNRDLIVKLED
ncbi:MAG: hypothetical protein DRJ49_03710 [Thermoprotei archaeon]|mgnify:CR=1 FL=1|nr:MAG: hypothetical protein DRN53_00050 [Thermoprotei archaeon]RLE89211.1 MAG: hypothetical protein DRJ49_03710 [Thermoprotei archaeon]